jgi:uncharacterized membrane protein YfcA
VTVFVVAVFFVATLVRATLGFGEALVAVPILAFVLPVESVAPVAVLVSITVAIVVLAQDWRHVHVRSAALLVVSSLVGIPFGVLLLRYGSESVVKAGLGLIIAGFALFALRSRHPHALTTDRSAWMFGALAGLLGGAYGMNAPPLVVYGALRRWSPEHFRATLQGYFLPASVFGMLGYWAAGLWTPSVSRYYLLSLPMVLLAVPLGRALNRRLDTGQFLVYVHAALLAGGIGLCVQAILAWSSGTA